MMMTPRQAFLKFFYPVLLKFSAWLGKRSTIKFNKEMVQPASPLYHHYITLVNGSQLSLETFKGKKLLLVNTASDCGYTAQYDALQKLHERFEEQLVIIAFPSNDFKQQEALNNAAIEKFCKINYHITFIIAGKINVVGNSQHSIYQWLSKKENNGWLNQQPGWNFCKYLINENGVLTHFFDTAISPLSMEITAAIESRR